MTAALRLRSLESPKRGILKGIQVLVLLPEGSAGLKNEVTEVGNESVSSCH